MSIFSIVYESFKYSVSVRNLCQIWQAEEILASRSMTTRLKVLIVYVASICDGPISMFWVKNNPILGLHIYID